MSHKLGLFVIFVILIFGSSVFAQGTIDPGFEPSYGSVELSQGFTPSPYVVNVVAGGDVDISSVASDCTGFVTEQPTFRLFWYGENPSFLRISVSGFGSDTTLFILDPEGNYSCNDDTFERDPAVDRDESPFGEYNIWVGSYSPRESSDAELYITEGGASGDACPQITPLRDSVIEQNGEQVNVTYTNPTNGQEFQITITGDSSEIDVFLSEAQLCLEATSSDSGAGNPPSTEVVDIAFGDILFDVIDETGLSVDDLVARRDSGEFQDTTLREFLMSQGYDADALQNEALSRAFSAIDSAQSEGILSERRANQARGEVELMYSQVFDEPGLPVLAGGRNPSSGLLDIDIELTNPGNVRSSREEGYRITIVLDPPIGNGWGRSTALRFARVQSARVDSLCATTGRVGGYIYLNFSYMWGGIDTTAVGCLVSGWYRSTVLYIVGWDANNYYILRSTFGYR